MKGSVQAGAEPITVSVHDLTKTYRRKQVLQGMDLTIEPGVTVLLGANGAGKSTLVRSLVQLEKPSSGSISYRTSSAELDPREIRRQLGWLPQTFGYPIRMRVWEFVRYAAWLKEADSGKAAVNAALKFADVHAVGNERLGALSVGTLRRVGLAAAVVHKPAVLVLDEPTAGLDPMQRSVFHERLRDLSSSSTILLATHLLEDAQVIGGAIIVIDNGRLLWTGDLNGLATAGDAKLDGTERLRSGFVSIVTGGDR